MYTVNNISNEPHQRHVLLLDDEQINLEIRYLAAVQIWIMSVEYQGRETKTLSLVAGAPILLGQLFPFEFLVTASEGVDPFSLDCFSSGRCKLWFVPQEELLE